MGVASYPVPYHYASTVVWKVQMLIYSNGLYYSYGGPPLLPQSMTSEYESWLSIVVLCLLSLF